MLTLTELFETRCHWTEWVTWQTERTQSFSICLVSTLLIKGYQILGYDKVNEENDWMIIIIIIILNDKNKYCQWLTEDNSSLTSPA